MSCIDDPTRPQYRHSGHKNLSSFLSGEMDGFLRGYRRDRQLSQPRHIEVLGEKNTLTGIIKPICREYYVPLTLGRGYASIPVWRDIARRFRASQKKAMTLIVASDFDPEGLDLADDAIRSLRDMWQVPVDYHRVAITRQQIEEQGLASDFNPAKATSSRLTNFVEKTGGNETWELEALDPVFLQRTGTEIRLPPTEDHYSVAAEPAGIACLGCAPARVIFDYSVEEIDPFLPGDFNFDDHVTIEDFLILSSNFGHLNRSWKDGDATLDGVVDFADFLILSHNFGATREPQLVAVPEPASLVLFSLGLSLVGMLRQRYARAVAPSALFENISVIVTEVRRVRIACNRRVRQLATATDSRTD